MVLKSSCHTRKHCKETDLFRLTGFFCLKALFPKDVVFGKSSGLPNAYSQVVLMLSKAGKRSSALGPEGPQKITAGVVPGVSKGPVLFWGFWVLKGFQKASFVTLGLFFLLKPFPNVIFTAILCQTICIHRLPLALMRLLADDSHPHPNAKKIKRCKDHTSLRILRNHPGVTKTGAFWRPLKPSKYITIPLKPLVFYIIVLVLVNKQ